MKKYFGTGKSSGNLGCFYCKDNKDETTQDTGCPSSYPMCGKNNGTHDGKMGNTCYKRETTQGSSCDSGDYSADWGASGASNFCSGVDWAALGASSIKDVGRWVSCNRERCTRSVCICAYGPKTTSWVGYN